MVAQAFSGVGVKRPSAKQSYSGFIDDKSRLGLAEHVLRCATDHGR